MLRNTPPYITGFVFLFFSALIGTAHGTDQHFSSGKEKNVLIELYTSEGCSSCPPADQWLSRFKDHPLLWKHFVPVAFHVDYWDWIGWKDEFAKPEYGERQKRYKAQRRTTSVYTPGIFTNGNEWRQFFRDRESIPATSNTAIGDLSATLKDGSITLSFTPIKPLYRELEYHVSLLSFANSNFIKWGENIGRTLKHDFVVVDYQSLTTQANDSEHKVPLNLNKIKKDYKASQLAIAVWVTNPKSGEVLQAVGGWLGQDKTN